MKHFNQDYSVGEEISEKTCLILLSMLYVELCIEIQFVIDPKKLLRCSY